MNNCNNKAGGGVDVNNKQLVKRFTDKQRLDWLEKQRVNVYDYSGYYIFRSDGINNELRDKIDPEINEDIEDETVWNKINLVTKDEWYADLAKLGYTREDLKKISDRCMKVEKGYSVINIMFKKLIVSINNYLTKPNDLGWSDKFNSYVTIDRTFFAQRTNLWAQDEWGRWMSHTSYRKDIGLSDKDMNKAMDYVNRKDRKVDGKNY